MVPRLTMFRDPQCSNAPWSAALPRLRDPRCHSHIRAELLRCAPCVTSQQTPCRPETDSAIAQLQNVGITGRRAGLPRGASSGGLPGPGLTVTSTSHVGWSPASRASVPGVHFSEVCKYMDVAASKIIFHHQVVKDSLPFQVEATLDYLMVEHYCALYCTYTLHSADHVTSLCRVVTC